MADYRETTTSAVVPETPPPGPAKWQVGQTPWFPPIGSRVCRKVCPMPKRSSPVPFTDEVHWFHSPRCGHIRCGTPQTHKPRAHQKPRGGRGTTHTREGPTRSRLPDSANVWPRRRCVYAPGRCDPHFGLGKREQTCHGSAIHEQKYVTGAPRTRHIALPQIPWVTLVTFGSLGTISCCNWRVRGGG